MSAPDEEVATRPVKVAAVRAATFLGFWLMISGDHWAELPVGLAASVAATWASLHLLSAGRVRLRPLALAALALDFLHRSAIAGLDVAWRALDPRLPLRPGFIACPLRLPKGPARSAFCALSSLLPGTLPVGIDENGAVLVHCVHVDQSVADNLAAEEASFIKALGYD